MYIYVYIYIYIHIYLFLYIYIYKQKACTLGGFSVSLWPNAVIYLFSLHDVSCRGCLEISGALPYSSYLFILKFYIQ